MTATDTATVVLDKVSADRGGVRILHDVCLSVGNETVTVFGLNGSGKSTLLRVVSGLTPSSGNTTYRGREVGRFPAYRRARLGLAFVKQDNQLFLELSVKENLDLGAYLLPKKALGDALERTLEVCPSLRDKLDRPAGALSGGERQVLAIGKAVIRTPDFLLVDEPSAGVSPAALSMLSEVFDKLRQLEIPILLVEQHLEFGIRIADRIVILKQGRVAHMFTKEQVVADTGLVTRSLVGEML